MSLRLVLLFFVAGLASAVAALSTSGCTKSGTVTVTVTPTPTPPSSTGSATVLYAGSSLTMSQVAAECGVANSTPFCLVNWIGVVTQTGGASGDHLIVNSLQFFTDRASWQNGTLVETTAGAVGALTYFTYDEDFGPGGTSVNPTSLAALVSSGGATFSLTGVTGTTNGASYSISTSDPGTWLVFTDSAGHTAPSPGTSMSNVSATGVLDSTAF